MPLILFSNNNIFGNVGQINVIYAIRLLKVMKANP